MSDVIAVSQSASRTYPVPTGVVAETLQGVRWARAYGTEVPEAYQQAASLLASGAALDIDAIDDLALLFDQAVHSDSTGWLPGQDGYPGRERILSSLAGGSEFREWSEGIFRSVGEQVERRTQGLLASIGYEPDVYGYYGLCASADPDLVTDLVRQAGQSPDTWQRWDASGPAWQDIDPSWVTSGLRVDPDPAMLAAIVDAVRSGDRLLLSYAAPATFLPSEMPVTTLPDDVDTPIIAAVVDDIDITAVWSLIRIEPGPQLSVRAAGQWEPLDEWPVSGHVASLVVLDDAELAEQVTAGMDAVDLGDPTVRADFLPDAGSAAVTADLAISIDHTFGEAIAQIGAYRREEQGDYDARIGGRRQARALVSDIETIREWAALRVRRDALTSAMNGNGRRDQDGMIAVADLGGKYHPGARRLRRYWTRGKGALKIAWGVHGDWRRCYRRLFKYMGPRAAGYCQLRHKETTGLYTGDKLHRAGVSTVRGSMEPCPEGRHRMPDGTCMSDEEMKAYTAAANAAVTAAYNGTGGMIALVPRTEDAERLYVEDGEDVTELHLTLMYLGESADYDASNRQRLVDMAADWARQVGRPIEAKVFGFAHWNPYGDDPCWVYSVGDGGDLTRIHDRVWDAWRGSDPVQPLPPPQHTPWHPHIAVVYTAADNVNLNDLVKRVGNVTFDRIRVSFGQDVTDIPLFSPMASESESSS